MATHGHHCLGELPLLRRSEQKAVAIPQTGKPYVNKIVLQVAEHVAHLLIRPADKSPS